MSRNHSRAEFERHCEERELVPFYSEPHELFLDIDMPMPKYGSSVWASQTNRIEDALRKTLGIEVIGTLPTTSKSGNTHLYYALNISLPEIERLLIQACMGSDPMKEFLSLHRLHIDGEYVSALAETHPAAITVNQWRLEMTNLRKTLGYAV